MDINHFTVIESVYGRFIVNRHCSQQIDALAKTGKTHIEDELKNIFDVVDKLPDDAIILDCGTNIGAFLIPVAHRVRGKNIKIIGFEPQRMMYNAILGSIALNDLENCWVHPYAVGSKESKVTLTPMDYTKEADYGTAAAKAVDAVENRYMRQWEADCITLDSLELPRIDFIKMDIEGYEVEALKGAKAVLERFRPTIWVEYHIIGVQAIKEVLGDKYNYKIMDKLNLLCTPK